MAGMQLHHRTSAGSEAQGQQGTPRHATAPTTPHSTFTAADAAAHDLEGQGAPSAAPDKQPLSPAAALAARWKLQLRLALAPDKGGTDAALVRARATMLLACLAWVLASSWAILINKYVMSSLGFGYPGAVAALGMVGTSIASTVAVKGLGVVQVEQPMSRYNYVTKVLPTGFMMALTFAAGNMAYLYLSVAFVQMLKAFTPVTTMAFSFLFRLERPTFPLIAAVATITAGVAAASYGEGNFSAFGVTAMLISVACEGLRLVLMQHVMAGLSWHPLEGLMWLAPACSGWLLLVSALTEWRGMAERGGLHVMAAHPMAFLVAACIGFGVNALAMSVISLASALTLKVLGICKDVALVMVGVVFLGESVSQLQLMGYMLSLSGFCWYNYIKLAPTTAASTQLHGSGTAGIASGMATHHSSSRGDHNGHSHIGVEEPLLKQVLQREERGETKPLLDTQEHNNAASWRL